MLTFWITYFFISYIALPNLKSQILRLTTTDGNLLATQKVLLQFHIFQSSSLQVLIKTSYNYFNIIICWFPYYLTYLYLHNGNLPVTIFNNHYGGLIVERCVTKALIMRVIKPIAVTCARRCTDHSPRTNFYIATHKVPRWGQTAWKFCLQGKYLLEV